MEDMPAFPRYVIVTCTDKKITFERSACQVKISADELLNIFSYCSQQIGFDISYKLSPKHEMSRPIF